MRQQLQAIRGMNDGLPEQLVDWQQLEAILRQLVATYGYQEIRTPIVEQANLFIRSMGEATDVVEKEIYLFNDRQDELLALRPEGTAGCVRAGIEHSLFYHQQQRLWYLGPMFRYERPQKGRYRQFHQFGVEVFGLTGPDIEAELILMTKRLWETLGVHSQLQLQINSIGSVAERGVYRQALVDYLQQNYSQLDTDSQRRLATNPLRILDSKHPQVQTLLVEAPRLSEYLKEDSRQHFADFCQLLTQLQIPYQVNERLVRGLDYYNRTVFEWVTKALGAQNTVCAGGRYDGLVEQLHGPPTPAVGFSLGLERLLLLWQQQPQPLGRLSTVDCYMMAAGQGSIEVALSLAEQIRSALPQLRVMTHCGNEPLAKQFKQANKVGAQFAIVLGERELAQRQVSLKRLGQPATEVADQWLVSQSQLVEQLQQLFNEQP